MGSNYDYTYDYEVNDSNKSNRNTRNNAAQHGQKTARNQSSYTVPHSTFSRSNNMDTLANFQHDRIWHKLYDPLEADRTTHENEVQKMARRPDRKVIKIEAAYGSDRQTLIIKRNYDLRVRDIQEDAAKMFRMPPDQIVLYWKGRNICDTPNELLEVLGVENNHQMRVCRADDPAQQNRRRELRSYATSDQQYSSSNDMYQQQQQSLPPYQQQPMYANQPNMYDQQQQFGNPSRANYYQQLTSPNAGGPVAPTCVLNLQIGFGDRTEGLAIGRPHPITLYDLQFELQQRFNIPVLDQNLTYNGMSLAQCPPDAPLDTLGIGNNSLISLWYRGQQSSYQQQPSRNDYYTARQQPPQSFYGDGSQMSRDNGGPSEMSPRASDSNMTDSMQHGNGQDVLKVEVFHGSDRHVIILRSPNNLRINDLMEELQRITNVPVERQKLYFHGHELQNLKDRTLRDAGIDNNAQIRLIGEPTKARYEAMISGNRMN